MRLVPLHLVCALALASTVLSGCFLWTTAGEGDELREQTQEHERRLTDLEQGIRAEREELARSVGQANAKVAELEEVLERATAVVTRNSADVGLQVQQLREQIDALEGQIAELRNQLRQAEERMEQATERLQKQAATGEIELRPEEIPGEKTEHYASAYRAFQGDQLAQARALFRAYLERYDEDDHADNAQYWIGATYLRQGRPATALGEFRKVLSKWPRGDAVDETLYDMGDAFYRLQACTDARAALQALIRSHPDSQRLSDARTLLRAISSAPEGHCTQ